MEKKGFVITSGAVPRYLVLACEVLYRELCLCASCSPNIIDLEFVSQGYHDLESGEMRVRLQERLDRIDSKLYDAVLLGFALCNNGIAGLSSANLPMVVPRAHDCITLLLGSKERYQEFFENNPGTYYLSSGWFERDKNNLEKIEGTVMSKLGLDLDYEDYVRRYGKEAADYIVSMRDGGFETNYRTIVLINTGVGPVDIYRRRAKEEAANRGFKYVELEGNLKLLQNMVDGKWNEEEFLLLEPNKKISPSYDLNIIRKIRI